VTSVPSTRTVATSADDVPTTKSRTTNGRALIVESRGNLPSGIPLIYTDNTLHTREIQYHCRTGSAYQCMGPHTVWLRPYITPRLKPPPQLVWGYGSAVLKNNGPNSRAGKYFSHFAFDSICISDWCNPVPANCWL